MSCGTGNYLCNGKKMKSINVTLQIKCMERKIRMLPVGHGEPLSIMLSVEVDGLLFLTEGCTG